MVERLFVEQDTVVRFYHSGPLLFRLTAGLWPLTPAIVVRIHEEQPIIYTLYHYVEQYYA